MLCGWIYCCLLEGEWDGGYFLGMRVCDCEGRIADCCVAVDGWKWGGGGSAGSRDLGGRWVYVGSLRKDRIGSVRKTPFSREHG